MGKHYKQQVQKIRAIRGKVYSSTYNCGISSDFFCTNKDESVFSQYRCSGVTPFVTRLLLSGFPNANPLATNGLRCRRHSWRRSASSTYAQMRLCAWVVQWPPISPFTPITAPRAASEFQILQAGLLWRLNPLVREDESAWKRSSMVSRHWSLLKLCCLICSWRLMSGLAWLLSTSQIS